MTKGRMDQLCNTGRLTFAGDTALTGTRLFNRNVLKALGLFDWRGQDIENTLKMALHSLHLQAKSFKNTGIYEIEENFTGAIDRFENGGTITVKKKTELTGNDLVLLGKLTSQEGLSYRGTHYVSAPETYLETLGDLDLTFSTPVTLKGTVKAKDGVDLWAPSLINESQFQVSEGVTRFFLDQGLFLNIASLTVDDFYYKGALINQGGQVTLGKVRPGIQTIVNLPKEAEKTKKPQEHSSGIRIGSGTVNPETVRNHSLFMMGKGKIETQGFDNEGGYADVDEFGFASKATPSIAGVFQAKKYTSSPLEHLDIQGSVTFLDGNMNAKDLLIAEQAVFSLGKGPHHTDKLHNLGTLVALKGMDLTTEILDNSCGVIESEAFRLVALEPDVKKRPDTAPTITITKFKKEGEKSQKTGVRGSSQLKPGTLKTKGDLTLELAAFVDIAYSLHQFGAKWQQGGTLSIYGGTFDQKNDITHAGRVCLTVKEYKNPQFTLQTNGLDLFVKDRFELGESHTVMGKIQTVEDPKIKTEQDNSLSITLEKGDLKIPYGQIYGEGEVTLTSSQGKVEVGQSLEGSVTKKPFRTFNLNGDMFDENGLEVSGPWLRHYNHEAFPRIYNVAYQKPNASFVCSNSDITLWAQKGIFLNHADIDAEGRVALITRPTEEILNLSSKVKAKDIWIKGRSYVHSRLAPYKAVQHEAGYEFWKEFAQSDPAHLEALGKILFDVNELHNIASIIMGIGGLYDGSHHRHSTSKPLDILREYEQTYHVGASHHQITLPYEASVPQVLSGTEAKLSARTAHFVGYLSAQDITFVADHLSVLFAMAAAWTNAGPSAGVHSTAPFVQKEAPEQGGGKYKRNPDGSVGYAIPKKDRSFDPGTAPVTGTKPLGFKPNARLCAPMNVFDSAAFDLMRRVAGRLYDKGLTGIQMLDRFLERGRHYARLGLLENPGSLCQIPEIIMFFREIPNGPVPLMILEMYFPESDVEENAERSGILRGVDMDLTSGSIDMTRARLKMEHDIKLASTVGDIKLMGTGVSAGHNVNLTAAQNLVFESLSERHIDDTNSYTDQKTTTFIHAGHDITAAAGLDAYRKGIVMKAGGNITLTAARRIVDEALALAHQTFHRQGGDWTLERVVHQSVSEYEAGGKFSQAAGVGQVLFAPKVTSQEAPLFISGEEGIQIHEVHDEYFLQSHKEGESGGLLGGGKNTEDVMSAEARSVGAQISSPEAAEFLSVGDIDLTNVSLQVPKITLTSINGVVRILLGTNYAQSARSSKKSDTLYQSQSMRQEQHQTYTASTKIPGDVEIHAREVIVEQVRGDTLDWLERIQLQGGGSINTLWRDEIHKVESHSVRGPTAAFGAVIALAAGIATSGVGVGGAVVSLTGVTGTTAAVISGATSAAFTTLCSQAAVALATNNGDIGKAAKSLTTSEAFKAMGFAMATAGLSETGLGRAAAGFTVDVAMGKKIDEAALNAARVAVVSTLQATAAKYIGAGGLDPVTRGMIMDLQAQQQGQRWEKMPKKGQSLAL